MNIFEKHDNPSFPVEHRGYRYSIEAGFISVEDLQLSLEGRPIHVTSRTWRFYEEIQAIPRGQLQKVTSSRQPVRVLNIGAGLDDTTEYLSVLRVPPVIIDPLRREDMYAGLEKITQGNISRKMRDQIGEYLNRLELMMSSSVIFLEKTFEDALLENLDVLQPLFDVVIDVKGAFWNPSATHFSLQDPIEIRQIEQSLLDPHGLRFYWSL